MDEGQGIHTEKLPSVSVYFLVFIVGQNMVAVKYCDAIHGNTQRWSSTRLTGPGLDYTHFRVRASTL